MESIQSRIIKIIFRSQLKTMDRLNIRVWDENTSVAVWREYCENSAAKAKLPAGVLKRSRFTSTGYLRVCRQSGFSQQPRPLSQWLKMRYSSILTAVDISPAAARITGRW
jgi:hypothetical protein